MTERIRPPEGAARRGARRLTVLALVAAVLVAAAWLYAGRPGGGALAGGPGYPEPSTATPAPATATPAPDAAGRFPPPAGVPHEVVVLEDSEFAAVLLPLREALAARDAAALAAWVDTGGGLALDVFTESEGYGLRLATHDVEALLVDLFNAGSEPVLQGYYCDPFTVSCGPPWVVITGLRGPVDMPTRDSAAEIGPQPPRELPLVAAWEIAPDGGSPWWRAWWLGDGYHDLVERNLAGIGTYYVLR